MKKFYVVYEANRSIYIATRKPKSGISFVAYSFISKAKSFKDKVTGNKREV